VRQDIADDPGLVPTKLVNERGPYVGRTPARRLRRFAHHAGLNEVMLELYRGFGPQRWWPARTPFEVVIGAILTQNTSWRNVELALASLSRRIPLTPASLLSLPVEELAAAIRSSGYYRTKARKLVEISRWYLDRGGWTALRREPLAPLRDDLLAVWGIGPETADSILCYALGRRTAVVDVYTRRVLARHELLDGGLPYEEVRAWLQRHLVLSQAVYEEFHALCVAAGARHCEPAPDCRSCPAPTPPALRPNATAPNKTVPFPFSAVSGAESARKRPVSKA